MLPDSRPERKVRGDSHIPPHWVENDATFFITINCQQRGLAQLTIDDLPARLFQSITHYHQINRWIPELVLLMPDHLHALISFTWKPGQGINQVIGDWKRYGTRQFGIAWQRDFFDHRIRSDNDHQSTWVYIRENPVRAGLVESYDEWPHIWLPDRIGW